MMRVPNISTYATSTYHLGNLTSDLKDANEVVSTQKRINRMSDDPVGLSQVLNLRTAVKNLDQIEKNVSMGKSWLSNVETSLDSVNDLILSAKTEANRLVNASAGLDERKNAVERVNSIIDQIVSLGNSQVNGNYIFSGTDTDVMPLEYDDNDLAPEVIYKGSETAFGIKSDRNLNVKVGRAGSTTFWNDKIDINSTNNTIVFKEDNGHGSGSAKVMTAVVPDGTYDTSKLETAVRNALNQASASDGYNVSYDVKYDSKEKKFSIKEDGSYVGFMRTEFMWKTGKDAYINKIKTSGNISPDDLDINVVNKDALTIGTPEPSGTKPFRLKWDGAGNWLVENNPGYVMPAKISGTDSSVDVDLNESGFPDISVKLDKPVNEGDYVEFEIVPAKGDHSIGHEIGFNNNNTIYSPPVSDTKAVSVTDITIIDTGVNENDKIDFEEVNSAGVSNSLTATIPPGNYTDMDSLAKAIETAMEAASAAAATPNNIDYAVTYDAENSRFDIRENGLKLNELHMNWKSGANAATSAGATLGYYPLDDVITYPESDNSVQGSITIDDTNNTLDFEEIDGAGGSSGVLKAVIPNGTYTDISGFSAAIKNAMETASAALGNNVTYDVAYDNSTHKFAIQENDAPPVLNELHLLWNTGPDSAVSIGETLGFDPASDDTGGGIAAPYTSDTAPVLMRFDSTDNVIDFKETNIDGTVSEAQKIEIPTGDYTDLDDVASEIQTELRKASPNNVNYIVSYDYTSGKFMIKGSSSAIKGFDLLWKTGENSDKSAAALLGFDNAKDDLVSFSESDKDVVNIVIDSSNNRINFRESTLGDNGKSESNLTAIVKQKTYTSFTDLAHEVEKALESESEKNGNKIDYSVSWDSFTKKFTIKENGTKLDELDLQWHSGADAPVSEGGTGKSIGSILGFDSSSDDIAKGTESTRPVQWGIFNTLIDFKQYLSNNDTDGIERTIERLETDYNEMTSHIVDTGMKYSRLEVRDSITKDANLSLTERKSMIEDADMIESVMKLQSLQTSYQASLASTSKIMNISLVDYLR